MKILCPTQVRKEIIYEFICSWAGHWVGLWHMWTRPSCPNNSLFIYFIFESVSLCIAVFFFEQCICSLTHVNHSPSFMKNNFLEKLFQRENWVCIHLSQRERKRHRVVCRVRTLCACSPCCRSFYDVRGSQSTTNCVRGEICFKKIVSNTRLDLIHSSFMQLVCEFLIICKFLLIYTVSIYCFYLSHLFVLLLIIRCMLFLFA